MAASGFRRLDPAKIVETLARLERRISERFPGAGLANVCADLTRIAGQCSARAERMARPNLAVRGASAAVIVLGVVVLGYVLTLIEVKGESETLFGVLQGIEALMNTLVIVGAAVIFLATLEGRWKRHRALEDLHELRSIIHVIDMHQLTKDPVVAAPADAATPSSPQRSMTPFELTRYLDYCSEMLSLAAKVAALYAQSSKDPAVIAAAGDLGQLTSNLSQKIWQKIDIVQVGLEHGPPAAGVEPSARAPT
ncbi:MAG TPA: hypothetical protein VNK52_01145 [Hyphomicrobiaceae bacterium]|nr:hypothetical protein [Hyphomicrobiaceae bacterium]